MVLCQLATEADEFSRCQYSVNRIAAGALFTIVVELRIGLAKIP